MFFIFRVVKARIFPTVQGKDIYLQKLHPTPSESNGRPLNDHGFTRNIPAITSLITFLFITPYSVRFEFTFIG